MLINIKDERNYIIMKLKAIDLAVFITLVFCICATVSFEKRCDGIREDILRLHVIANSDSKEDQALKLKIRDAILENSASTLEGCDDIISAKTKIGSSVASFRDIAQQCVFEHGYDYNVSIYLDKSYFPTRVYDNVTMPAGYYNALKIVIGKGEGKNWWCVMFPSLCLPGAYKKEDRLKQVLTEQELELVLSSPNYEVRFWLVEKYYDIKNAFCNKNNTF